MAEPNLNLPEGPGVLHKLQHSGLPARWYTAEHHIVHIFRQQVLKGQSHQICRLPLLVLKIFHILLFYTVKYFFRKHANSNRMELSQVVFLL